MCVSSYRFCEVIVVLGEGAIVFHSDRIVTITQIVRRVQEVPDLVATIAGVAKQLSMDGLGDLRPIKNTVIVPISGIHRGVVCALQYAKSIALDHVQAVYVDFDEEATTKLREKWERWGAGVRLVVLPSPYRELTRPLLRYITRLERRNGNSLVTVLLPEFVPAKWWQHLLHNQSSLMLKGAHSLRRG